MERDFLIDSLRLFYTNKPEVLFGYLFGSYAKRNEKDGSDIDVGIFINNYNPKTAFSYRQEESEKLQKKFDKEFDLIVINEAPPILRHEIIKYGFLFKDEDHQLLVDYKVKSFFKYLDQMYIINRFFEKNKARITGEENGINQYKLK